MKTTVRVKGSPRDLHYIIESPNTCAAILEMLEYLDTQERMRVIERAAQIDQEIDNKSGSL